MIVAKTKDEARSLCSTCKNNEHECDCESIRYGKEAGANNVVCCGKYKTKSGESCDEVYFDEIKD